MGRRTDVGILSMFATMDTSQFTKALDKTGQKTKAWAVRIKGTMNSIGGSVTELNSRISFMAGSLEMATKMTTGLKQASDMFFEPTAANAEALQKTLESMPMGIGAVASAFRQLLESMQGDYFSEFERLINAQVEQQANAMDQLIKKRLEMRDMEKDTATILSDLRMKDISETEKAFVEYHKKRAALDEEGHKKRLEQAKAELAAFDWAQVSYEFDNETADTAERTLKQEVMIQQEMVNAIKAREDALFQVYAARRKELEQERQAKEEAEQRAEFEKKQAQALEARAKKAKELQDLMKSYGKQQEKIAGLQGQQAAGATQTVSTAIGAIKIGDESQTRALQQAQLAELRKETQILEDIRQNISRSGGALV